MVVSDHGFATVKVRVELADLLIAQGLKKSAISNDVIVARNRGSDAIYLSPRLAPATRRRLLRKIVDYVGRQEWSGPIFSRSAGASSEKDYLGEIQGTFSQRWFSLFNPARSPDLIISFRELADEDNSRLTGPAAPAFVLGPRGMRSEPNRSQPAIHSVPGVAYADGSDMDTTGTGTHGGIGKYQMGSFCAALGPDFRRGYVDHAPTSNLDVAHTIAELLHTQPTITPRRPAPRYGRVMEEAFENGPAAKAHEHTRLSAILNLARQHVITTVELERIGDEKYVVGTSVRHIR